MHPTGTDTVLYASAQDLVKTDVAVEAALHRMPIGRVRAFGRVAQGQHQQRIRTQLGKPGQRYRVLRERVVADQKPSAGRRVPELLRHHNRVALGVVLILQKERPLTARVHPNIRVLRKHLQQCGRATLVKADDGD